MNLDILYRLKDDPDVQRLAEKKFNGDVKLAVNDIVLSFLELSCDLAEIREKHLEETIKLVIENRIENIESE